MKKNMTVLLTLILTGILTINSFADTHNNLIEKTIIQQNQEKTDDDQKIDTYIIDHKLYLSAEDIMNILKYTKENSTQYTYENKNIVFDSNNKTITINGMSKSLPEDILYYMDKTLISTKAVEDIFGKVLTTSAFKINFNIINKHNEKPMPYAWTENRVIAHALGTINGVDNSNSLDAMMQSYKNNFRLFEVDLLPTVNGELVASHGFYDFLAEKYGRPIPNEYSNELPTKEEFSDFKFNGVFSTLDLEKLIIIMSANPDIYVITDTKFKDNSLTSSQFKEIVRICKQIDESVLDRIIPQIYTEEMYDAVMAEYKFESIIYTLYAASSTNYKALEFATAKGIQVITIPPERINKKDMEWFNSYGIKIYTHTINDLEQMKKLLDMGIYGFYTDSITPEQLNSL